MALNVLIVDDSGLMRSMISKTLTMAEVPVKDLHQAADGQEALSILDEHWIDLVFVDVNMPVMDGSEMVERMSQDPLLRSIPIILLTSEGPTSRVEKMRTQGVRAYLRKPCTPESIKAVVEDVIGDESVQSKERVAEKIFRDVMQNLAYVFCELAEKESLETPEGPFFSAEIEFSGRVCGSLEVVLSQKLSREVASNILGVESVGAPERGETGAEQDAVKELVSVTCGHVLTGLVGEGPVFDLSAPALRDVEGDDWARMLEDPSTSALSVDGDVVLLRLKVRDRHR